MNFLAHAYLTPCAGALRVGNLMADCLPAGRIENLAVPPGIADGIRLHRRIDSVIDHHPVAHRSRARLPSARRRASGIIVDMAYDHFLARYWDRFHTEHLPDFTERCYREIESHDAYLSDNCRRLIERMRHEDWLTSYANSGSLRCAIDRIAGRLRRPELLSGSGADIMAVYAELETDFFAFMPAINACVATWYDLSSDA